MININLDTSMWSEDSIQSSWKYDPNCLQNLTSQKNVNEFMKRSRENHDFVIATITNIEAVTNKHNLKIINHFPSGVGGLTFSVIDENNNHCVLKFYSDEQQFMKAKESTQLIYKVGLGPEILTVGSNYLVFEAIKPGTPIRSKKISLNILEQLIKDLGVLSKIPYSRFDKNNVWHKELRIKLEDLSARYNEVDNLLKYLDKIKDKEVYFSHGDAQLGNILTGNTHYSWIDPEPELAPKEADLARLYTHTCSDLLGDNPSFKIDDIYKLFINNTNLDKETFLIIGCIKAFTNYVSLGFGPTKRIWESKAYYTIYEQLLSELLIIKTI